LGDASDRGSVEYLAAIAEAMELAVENWPYDTLSVYEPNETV
jgi:hypothetical protein